ncbi:hypothetical protein D4R87_01325 [bacterium]|nr:MAG: hypothetical protein D4R87_01325 [bacterium]
MLKHLKENKFLYIAFLCVGLFVGSLIVDIGGLGEGKISKEYLSSSTGSIFQTGEKTWISYDNPIIEMTVLNDSSCSYCDPSKEVLAIKQNISPTIVAKDLDVKTQGGENLIDLFNIKSLPAFIFSKEIEDIQGFENLTEVLIHEGSYYMLDPARVGMEPFKILGFDNMSDAKVTIVEFGDYQCPYSKQGHEALMKAVKDYSEDDVEVIFKHMPLSFHDLADEAAMATECARKQGAFHQMSEALFEADLQSLDDIKAVAQGIEDIHFEGFEICFDSETTRSRVGEDKQLGQEIGVSGTPVFIINGRFISGARDADDLKDMIEDELESANAD